MAYTRYVSTARLVILRVTYAAYSAYDERYVRLKSQVRDVINDLGAA